ncbi:Lnb N-terminal periplasmic domain-containing protein [Enterobacter bugandensis]
MENNEREPDKAVPWLEEYSQVASTEWHDSDNVHISHVRNFRYQADSSPVPDWYDFQCKLSDVIATDLIVSYWAGNAIAHVFLSFGFNNGKWLAISIETRRRQNQPWSAFGGFLKNYPLVYVVADERDLIGVRANVRKERVYLYPLNITCQQSQELFRSYLLRIEKVNRHPEWYNTLLNNCTSNIFQHGKSVSSAVKYDWRILLSGYADRYCYKNNLLKNSLPFEELKMRSRLRGSDELTIETTYSQDIRRNR